MGVHDPQLHKERKVVLSYIIRIRSGQASISFTFLSSFIGASVLRPLDPYVNKRFIQKWFSLYVNIIRYSFVRMDSHHSSDSSAKKPSHSVNHDDSVIGKVREHFPFRLYDMLEYAAVT